ncbi:MAG: sugar transferase [Eubacteriales bacterium]|nr:sugar transferase [Eubacteriales bacterium]
MIFYLFQRLFPDKNIGWTYIFIPIAILCGELILFTLYKRIVLDKISYFYESVTPESTVEDGWHESLKCNLNSLPPDLEMLVNNIRNMKGNQARQWIVENKDKFSEGTYILESTDPKQLYKYADKQVKILILVNSLGSIWHLNTFLANANMLLCSGGYIAGHCLTSGLKRDMIRQSNPPIISHIMIFADYLWHRVIPKLSLTKQIYFFMTKGRNREFSRVEILGRVCMAGFDIIDDDVRQGNFFVTARKTGIPVSAKPNTGPLIRLKRIGKGGKLIGVYKFRTMHAYSEYLQGYVYNHCGLQSGGKMNHDYRVTTIGRIFRKYWIDELPMLINWIKGEMKLVGVRPLSEHYFSLYTPEMQDLRIKTKPGLIPPFYAEKAIPVSLSDVQANERRYLEQYLKHPVKTDWKYFRGAMKNIVFKGAKSR